MDALVFVLAGVGLLLAYSVVWGATWISPKSNQISWLFRTIFLTCLWVGLGLIGTGLVLTCLD